ncbi:MAG: Rieske (2Fe-2S) protein, partial [Candidatus Methylomirabilis sp.]|nr:Rieske (2Fe-2S) protein [Deltaproteobacteria bacterium]
MNHALEVELIERVLKLLEQGTTHMAEGQARAPVERYLSPERFAREERTLFRRRPLILGHASRLAAPGDFFTHDLAGVPILCVRDRGGRFRAFLNVCRHRGTRVVEAEGGRDARSFACPYHAWTYGLDGRLLGLPHADGFPEIDRDKTGLVALPAEEFAGFLWAVPTPGPGLDARAALGPLAA